MHSKARVAAGLFWGGSKRQDRGLPEAVQWDVLGREGGGRGRTEASPRLRSRISARFVVRRFESLRVDPVTMTRDDSGGPRSRPSSSILGLADNIQSCRPHSRARPTPPVTRLGPASHTDQLLFPSTPRDGVEPRSMPKRSEKTLNPSRLRGRDTPHQRAAATSKLRPRGKPTHGSKLQHKSARL